MIERALLLVVLATSCAFAQEKGNVVYQAAGPVTSVAWGASGGTVQGAPYSATITNESVQTLADGNRIVQTTTGETARDSQGRTRQDTALPAIGNLSAANAPHLVFLNDPVAQTSYVLNLSEKTAQKMAAPPPLPGPAGGGPGAAVGVRVLGGAPLPPDAAIAAPAGGFFIQKQLGKPELEQGNTEDLGSETMEGVVVNGVRTTRTFPAGEIGNERPISIVTEVWTSPDLKVVVYSKRSDPRMGEQTFRLSNIVRSEPAPSLFLVPADFKVVDGGQPVMYRAKP